MAKILIRNRAEPAWKPIIDAKLQVMLGSMLAHINRIDIEFDRSISQCGGVTYTCTVVLTESRGQRFLLFNQQPDANLAIEGAMARSRRAITRLSRARVNSWGQASAQ